jgi:hypothetical protein
MWSRAPVDEAVDERVDVREVEDAARNAPVKATMSARSSTPNGAARSAGQSGPMNVNPNQFRLNSTPSFPRFSNRMTTTPAGRSTSTDSVVQSCQPPVAPKEKSAPTAEPPNRRRNAPPEFWDATRASIRYAPACWMSTVYSIHSPACIQPTL